MIKTSELKIGGGLANITISDNQLRPDLAETDHRFSRLYVKGNIIWDGGIYSPVVDPNLVSNRDRWYCEGTFKVNGSATTAYRISDLQVDDYVEMQLVKTFFEPPVCTAIRISRRSGGRVPPAPGEVEERERRPSNRPMWHERVNALQDWEEKGIPVPIRFLSTSERLEHVAPPPRLKQ